MKRSHIYLLVVLAGLALAVWWLNKNPAQPESDGTPTAEATSAIRPVIAITADQITAVKIENIRDSQILEIAKNADGTWSIHKPVQDAAEATQVELILANLVGMQSYQTISNAVDLDIFGLINPSALISITLQDGTKHQILLGKNVPTGENFYAQLVGSPDVLIVNAALVQSLFTAVATPPVAVPTATATVEAGPVLPSATP
ncbi:MAG TPA: DUF4340 domain-containing protein [Anaerolineales bacterium]|nr:DUF4340 domain-containing protein [Anaerolineales bacterium]